MAPPSSATGVWPQRRNQVRTMMPSRLPRCRLSAVGSNPQYTVKHSCPSPDTDRQSSPADAAGHSLLTIRSNHVAYIPCDVAGLHSLLIIHLSFSQRSTFRARAQRLCLSSQSMRGCAQCCFVTTQMLYNTLVQCTGESLMWGKAQRGPHRA